MNREIYEYWNGSRQVFADPVDLLGEFVAACGGDYRGYIQRAYPKPYPEDQGAIASIRAAQQKLYAAVRHAFKLVPFSDVDGSGVTTTETYKTLKDFMDWWTKKKMPTVPIRTSPTPTDSRSQSATMECGAGCGSTSAASACGTQL